MKDADLWDDFRFNAWIDEMDFRPLIEDFYEERFGIKSGKGRVFPRPPHTTQRAGPH